MPTLNLLFWFVGGDAYLAAVYGYHVQKDQKPLIGEFLKTLYLHTPLFVGLVLAPTLGAWQRFRSYALAGGQVEAELPGSFFAPFKLWDEPALGSVKLAFLVCVTMTYEFTLFQELYGFYFALLFPTAAYCTGFTLAAIGGAIVDGMKSLAARDLRPFAVALAFVFAWGSWVPLALEANWAFSNPGTGRDPQPAKGVNPGPGLDGAGRRHDGHVHVHGSADAGHLRRGLHRPVPAVRGELERLPCRPDRTRRRGRGAYGMEQRAVSVESRAHRGRPHPASQCVASADAPVHRIPRVRRGLLILRLQLRRERRG